jgi:cysteine desulfurase/selenocysteine lyase
MERLGLPGTNRASFAVYNTRSEVDALVTALIKAQKMLA